MKLIQFQLWLQGKLTAKAISDCLSRCKRVEERLGLDLDIEFAKNKGHDLLSILNGNSDKIIELLSFSPTANIKEGMNSLKSATKKYFLFLSTL